MPACTRPGVTALRAAGVIALLQAIFVLAYVVPGRDAQPHDLPVAVVGPPATTAPLSARLEQGGFDVLRVRSAKAARAAVEEREAYGALMLDGPQPSAVTASGASIVAKQVIVAVAELARVPSDRIEDVAPLTEEDPRGVAFNLLVLPLLVTSILGAQIATLILGPAVTVRDRLLISAGTAAVAGLLTATLVGPVLAVVPGSFLATAGILTLAIAGILLPSGGLIRLLGPKGLGVAFGLFLVVGNPSSGTTSAPELVPQPWQFIGEFLPPGPAVTALRNTAYFDGAALTRPLLAMIGTVLVGIALELVAVTRRRRAHPIEATSP